MKRRSAMLAAPAIKVAPCAGSKGYSRSISMDRLELFALMIWHDICVTLCIMAVQKQLPMRPRSGYRLAALRPVIRCFWNRIIVAVAIRAILILYALLQYVLTKYRAE